MTFITTEEEQYRSSPQSVSSSSQSIPNRDLIREYFARSCAVPPIFKPSFQPFSPPPQLEIAYKHPRLLLQTSTDEEDDESACIETNRGTEIKYVDDNSIELLDAGKQQTNATNARRNSSSRDVITMRKTAFISISDSVDNSCKLIGKVNPNLVKTWEQLNGSTAMCPSDSNQKQYHVNHVIHHQQTESSEDFYDSIDDEIIDELNQITSICLREPEDTAAGEMMAQYESFDKRRACWSMEGSGSEDKSYTIRKK